MSLNDIFKEACNRNIEMLSITDHDSIDCQAEAMALAEEYKILYISGLELSVLFKHPKHRDLKPISLDFLAYDYDIGYAPLVSKLNELRKHRVKRAGQILEKINMELSREDIPSFTNKDLEAIQDSVDGAFGRPHIAEYLIKKGLAADKQDAFDKYLVRCNVPKMPLSLNEASDLIKRAGGKLLLAHPNHPRGTSLIKFTDNLDEQQQIIEESMLDFIDGIECWHSEQDESTSESYLAFAERLGLMVSGGTDCHQQPVIMGTLDIPGYIAEQFNIPS